MKEFEDFAAAEHFIRYFYKEPVTFLDYFDEDNTLVFLDETNRLLEKGRLWRQNFGRA